jgi:glycosyltransferase involved in cell wall biosynthesis
LGDRGAEVVTEADHPAPGGGLARGDLETRLAAIERRLAALEGRGSRPRDREALETEVATLREAVADLGADVLDLHNQLDRLVSSCERLLAGAAGGGELGRRSSGGAAGSLRRAGRRTLKKVVESLRRLGSGGGGDDRPPKLELDLEVAAETVRRAPRLAVVLAVTGDPAAAEVPAALRRQTDPELEVVLWNEGAGRAVVHGRGGERADRDAPDRAALAGTLAAEWVAEADAVPSKLEATVVELCRWTLASEGLPLVVEVDGGTTSRPRVGWRIEPVATWAGAAAPRRSDLAKAVGGRDWHPAVVTGRASVAAGGGRAYLTRAGRRGRLSHEVAPLAGVVQPLAGDDGRPAVLVLSSAGDGGRLAAWLLRAAAAELRPVVLLVGDAATSPARDALAALAPEVYPAGAWLEPAVAPSLAADLVRARGIRTVLRIGGPLELSGLGDARPVVVDWPLEPDHVAPGADRVLAVGEDIARRARAAGLETVDLVPSPELPGEPPDPARLAAVRAAYGIADNVSLVLALCDLEPDRRPEDVAAVAWRLRDRDDVRVLLVGRGSLAGTVSDIAGHLGLERFSFSPPGHPPAELVAACDCVLSTAERDPWPLSVAAGLALGRPVIACGVDGVRELTAAAGGRSALCPPGDVDALARAVSEALDGPRPRITKKAWKAAADRSRRCRETVLVALGGNGGTAEAG